MKQGKYTILTSLAILLILTGCCEKDDYECIQQEEAEKEAKKQQQATENLQKAWEKAQEELPY